MWTARKLDRHAAAERTLFRLSVRFLQSAFATFGSLAIAPRADPAAPPALYAGFSFLTQDASTEYVWGEVVWTTDGTLVVGTPQSVLRRSVVVSRVAIGPGVGYCAADRQHVSYGFTAGSADYDVCWIRDEGATIGCAVLGQAFVGASALVIDPGNANIVYAGTNGSGVYKTTNGGSTWSGGGAGVVRSLAIDSHAPSIIYAGTDILAF